MPDKRDYATRFEASLSNPAHGVAGSVAANAAVRALQSHDCEVPTASRHVRGREVKRKNRPVMRTCGPGWTGIPRLPAPRSEMRLLLRTLLRLP